jgi:ubiquitin-conjugating enzyme E2 variant
MTRYFVLLWTLACLTWAGLWLAVLPWPAWWLALVSAWAAWVTADAGSYVFHVFLDHHLRASESPMARGFQEHHADGARITREPLPAVLAPVVPLVLPVWLLAAIMSAAGWLPSWLAFYAWVLGLGVGFGQIFHRWAHLERPCGFVRLAQRLRLVVGRDTHAEHHAPPFGTRYAIVSGWVNPLFDALRIDVLVGRLATWAGFPRVA